MGRTVRDPAWKHGTMVNGMARRVKCNYCEHVMSGGVTRLKLHLSRKGGDVTACTRCPEELSTEMKKLVKEAEQKRERKALEQVKRAEVDKEKELKEEEEEANHLEQAIKESLDTFEMEKRKAEMDEKAYEAACRESVRFYETEKIWRGEGCSSSSTGTKRKAAPTSSSSDSVSDIDLDEFHSYSYSDLGL